MTGGCSGAGELSGLVGRGGIKGVVGVLDILLYYMGNLYKLGIRRWETFESIT